MFIMCILTISSISASNNLIESLSTNNNGSEAIYIPNSDLNLLSGNGNDVETPDIPDLIVNDKFLCYFRRYWGLFSK